MSLFHRHPHPRRKFLKRGFVFLGASAASPLSAGSSESEHSHPTSPPEPQVHPAGSASSPARPAIEPQEAASRPIEIFDAHLHCPSDAGDVWQWHPVTRTFEEFDAYLSATGVHRGIINSVRCQEAKTPAEFIAGNREVARRVDASKGRFVGACVVNPLFIDESLREIEECHRQLGFVWVGELCNYVTPWEYTLKEFDLLVEQVVKLNMVLDVHTELEEMNYIIEKFPQATIVFPHFGDDREYDHIFKRIDLVAKYPNCYLDTSGYGHDRVGMLEYAVKTIGPDRILFGSDFSINDPATVIARIRHAFVSQEVKEKILSANLRRLLRRVGA